MARMLHWRRIAWLLSALMLAPLCGCVGLVATLLYDGHKINAAYDGLKESRVAVICVESSSYYEPDSVANVLAKDVARLLEKNVKKIELIDQQKVADWMDRNSWEAGEYDFRKIGEGLGADKVVAIELHSFSLYDGATMYRGRCEASLSVYDINDKGKEVYSVERLQVAFPVSGGRAATSGTEWEFRRVFLDILAYKIARHFYAYDMSQEFALDATYMGG